MSNQLRSSAGTDGLGKPLRCAPTHCRGIKFRWTHQITRRCDLFRRRPRRLIPWRWKRNSNQGSPQRVVERKRRADATQHCRALVPSRNWTNRRGNRDTLAARFQTSRMSRVYETERIHGTDLSQFQSHLYVSRLLHRRRKTLQIILLIHFNVDMTPLD